MIHEINYNNRYMRLDMKHPTTIDLYLGSYHEDIEVLVNYTIFNKDEIEVINIEPNTFSPTKLEIELVKWANEQLDYGSYRSNLIDEIEEVHYQRGQDIKHGLEMEL